MSSVVLISLGSNLGDRAWWLKYGLNRLNEAGNILASSRVYSSASMGTCLQPDYLNFSLCLSTHLEPLDLLFFTQQIENECGRTGKGQLLPRQLDIDIIQMGTFVSGMEELILPHPRMHERAFVLAPSAEICPHLLHPVLGETISELLAKPLVQNQAIQKTSIWLL